MKIKNKFVKSVLVGLLIFNIAGCVQPSSPAIYFVNLSNDYIRNVEGNWNRYRLHGAIDLTPTNDRSQTFNIESKSHIFGPVRLEWENTKGKKFRKDFVFKKEELPTYVKMFGVPKDNYDYIRFYFTQDGVEYITSDTPNIENIRKEMHALGEKSFEQFKKKYPCWDLNEPSKTRYIGTSVMQEPNPNYEEELAAYNKKCKK